MALLTCAGAPVVSGALTLLEQGGWHASLRLDTDRAPSGAVELRWREGPVWRATVVLGGVLVEGGPVAARLIGGAGGLGREIPGASYRQVTVRVVLGQLLAEAGEALAGSTPPALLARILPRWSRAGGTPGAQLTALARHLGVVWRVLPSGEVWLGAAPAPSPALPDELTVIQRRPALAQVEIATGAPWALVPGGVWEGKRIASVVHHLAPTSLRSLLCLR